MSANYLFGKWSQEALGEGWGNVLVCLGCHDHIPRTGGLKQQKFIFSHFWGLEVQDHGASRVEFLRGLRFLVSFSYGCPSVCTPAVSLCGLTLLFFFFLTLGLFIYLFIYLWLCWVFVSVRGLSLVGASGGHSSSRCAGLSLSRPLLLWSTSSRRAGSVVVAHGPSCSAACGILPDQGSNPCPLHWQADSQPPRHQGSPA